MSNKGKSKAVSLRALRVQRGVEQDGWTRGPLPADRGFPDFYGLTETWIGPRVSVQVSPVETEWGEVVHLIVRRHDGGRLLSWYELQEAKDRVCGPEREAVEVFPPRAEIVDGADLRHLWVLPLGTSLPFGLFRRPGAGLLSRREGL